MLVEDDLFFRQYRFHKQKLVLHRAGMRHFEERLRLAKMQVDYIETSSRASSQHGLGEHLRRIGASGSTYFDVVDDWLDSRLRTTLRGLGIDPVVEDSPGFITSRTELELYFSSNGWRMQNFYEWQRKRLGLLIDSDGGPVGGKWSFDADNRRRLPRNLAIPPMPEVDRTRHVAEAITWVNRYFHRNPGSTEEFNWPVTHQQASAALEAFLLDRFDLFGPYEDAIAAGESYLFHSALSSSLNVGLLTPTEVIDIALDHAARRGTSIASVEGFVRQIIGWREYMRSAYALKGRAIRTRNELQFSRPLDPGWWTGDTGLAPVDAVVGRINQTCYAHHIERLMVLGNAMLLLRTDPNAVYEWFMEMFIDAYDWVMVPNVYAMSQYAAGNMITTKPYVSGSNYLRKMGDFPRGDWEPAWDALYWQFVDDHRGMFSRNPRSKMMVTLFDGFDDGKKQTLRREAGRWLGE